MLTPFPPKALGLLSTGPRDRAALLGRAAQLPWGTVLGWVGGSEVLHR